MLAAVEPTLRHLVPGLELALPSQEGWSLMLVAVEPTLQRLVPALPWQEMWPPEPGVLGPVRLTLRHLVPARELALPSHEGWPQPTVRHWISALEMALPSQETPALGMVLSALAVEQPPSWPQPPALAVAQGMWLPQAPDEGAASAVSLGAEDPLAVVALEVPLRWLLLHGPPLWLSMGWQLQHPGCWLGQRERPPNEHRR